MLTLSGMRGLEAVQLIKEMAAAPQLQPEPAKEEEEEALPSERLWGFCQMCEHTIGNCICEDGPY